MKFAIAAAPFLTAAVVDLLDGHGYDDSFGSVMGNETTGFFQVNTTKKTFKHRPSTTRTVYNPATRFAEIVALVEGSVTTAPAAPATTSAFAVGDRVTAVNTSKTKAKFRLQEGHVYTVDRITAKGNLGLAGLPNDEYLKSRFTKVAEANGFTATAGIAPVSAVDADGNELSVGDTVLVTVPSRRDGRFPLEADAVLTITEITPKGNIGFGGADQYLPNRVVKVELVDAVDEDGELNVTSGDHVVCVRNGKHNRNADNASKFALPLNKLLTFRGVTVEKGNFILDGYTEHQYSPSRFKLVVRD